MKEIVIFFREICRFAIILKNYIDLFCAVKKVSELHSCYFVKLLEYVKNSFIYNDKVIGELKKRRTSPLLSELKSLCIRTNFHTTFEGTSVHHS